MSFIGLVSLCYRERLKPAWGGPLVQEARRHNTVSEGSQSAGGCPLAVSRDTSPKGPPPPRIVFLPCHVGVARWIHPLLEKRWTQLTGNTTTADRNRAHTQNTGYTLITYVKPIRTQIMIDTPASRNTKHETIVPTPSTVRQ